MRTPTKPWYRASKDAWYVEINGKQVRLAKGRENEKAARDAFYKLMANGSGKLPEADTLRVATVCDLFLDHSQKHHVPDSYQWYRGYLQDFCNLYGTLLVQDLRPLHVSKWLDAHPGWKGGRRGAVIAVKQAFNWAEAHVTSQSDGKSSSSIGFWQWGQRRCIGGILTAVSVDTQEKPDGRRRWLFLSPADRAASGGRRSAAAGKRRG